MRNDEFNEVKIVNEDENPNFEFGNTQDAEFTSYADNDNRLRDEINDNPHSNDVNKKEDEDRKDKKESKESSESSSKNGKGSSGGGASSAATTIATVAGAAMVSVAALSTLIGVNLFFNAKCTMNNLDTTPVSVTYDLDLTDTEDDSFIISLENEEYKDSKDLVEGKNEGLFENLKPSTKYSLAVIDVTYNNYVMYKEDVFTKAEMSYTVSFETNGGSPVEPQLITEGGFVTEPANPSKEGYSFNGWYTEAELHNKYDFATPVFNDFILYAGWLNESVAVSVSFDPNGGSGIMEGMSVNSGDTIILPECTFTSPDESKIFNRWRMNSPTGTSYLDGAEVTITEDTIFYASWKDDDRYVIEFDGNGGSGTMDPLKTQTYSPEVPTSDFTAPEGYYFDHWYFDYDETQIYYPGEKIDLAQRTGNTLVAYWLPDVDLKFHVEYIDLDATTPILHFTYTFWDNSGENNKYVAGKFEFVFKTIAGDEITYGDLAISDGTMSSGYDLDLSGDNLSKMQWYDAFDYYLYGIADKNGEEVRLNPVKGSFLKKDVVRQAFNDVYIGGIQLENNAVVPYFLLGSGTAYLALQLDYSDPLNAYGGFNYEYQLDGGGGGGDVLETTRGCQYLNISYSADSMIYSTFTIFDNNSNQLRSYSNITVEKTDNIGIFGFNINESDLGNLNMVNRLKIKMVGNGYNNGTTISDLHGENFKLTLEPQLAGSAYSHHGRQVKFVLSFTPTAEAGISDVIVVNVDDSIKEDVSKFFRYYPITVTLSYSDTTSGEVVSVTSYTKHTFTYK